MAVEKTYLKGLNTVLRNLKKETDKIPGKTLKGLIRAAIIIRRDMDKTSPLIPVDLGNLRASFFVVTSTGRIAQGKTGSFKGKDSAKLASDHKAAITEAETMSFPIDGPYVIIGFSANYAIYVHENIDATFQRPGAGAKFLESAIDRNTHQILYTIAKEAKI